MTQCRTWPTVRITTSAATMQCDAAAAAAAETARGQATHDACQIVAVMEPDPLELSLALRAFAFFI